MMFWMWEGRDEKDWHKAKAMLEVPPPGYTGSLAGTGWDADEMLSEYEQASGEVSR